MDINVKYAKMENNIPVKTFKTKPNWVNDDGNIVSDQFLKDNENMYPVKNSPDTPTKWSYIDKKDQPVENWHFDSENEIIVKKCWFYSDYKPSYDRFYQFLEKKPESEWEQKEETDNDGFLQGRILIKYNVLDKALDTKKEEMTEEAANLRWKKEVGGMSFIDENSDTLKIHTDRESQSKIIGAFQSTKNGVRTDGSKWKTYEGFVPISNSDMEKLGYELLNFIQSCYDREEEVITLIKNSNSIDELKSVRDNEFGGGWPMNALSTNMN